MTKEEIAAIGKRLKRARKALKLTQADVANKLGCSLKHYGCLERGIFCISIESMIKFRILTGIEFEYLLTGEVTQSNDFSFFEKYNRLSPVDRLKAETMLDVVFDSDKSTGDEDE